MHLVGLSAWVGLFALVGRLLLVGRSALLDLLLLFGLEENADQLGLVG